MRFIDTSFSWRTIVGEEGAGQRMRMRMNQAITRAIADEMEQDPSVMVFGEDIAVAEGPFKTSEGLLATFGPLRVRDTPISETGFLGAAVGAAMTGMRPVAEIMFIEFLGVAFDQVVTEAALMHYLSGGRFTVPMVVRASVGSGLGFGCQHSQTLERWMLGTPGLKLAVASGARSAYGLTRAAIRDNNPVVILEPRSLYGEREDVVLGEQAIIKLGTAETLRSGNDVTIVTLGQTVRVGLEAEASASWSGEILDLRSLMPWDKEAVLESVRRTGHLVIVEENQYTGGWGTEVAAYVMAQAFSDLKAPVLRITAPDVPVPFGLELEQRFLPSAHYVGAQVSALLASKKTPAPWWEEYV
jgi:acetoin:2,6-dichlorophenolindophenol oxidoreductase subunit beta